MGGYLFTKGVNQQGEIAYMNLPTRNIWWTAISIARETDFLASARCPADRDGECQCKGCLNESGRIALEIPMQLFLDMNKRTLSFIESCSQRFHKKAKALYRVLGDITVTDGQSESVVTKEFAEKFAPDRKASIAVLKHLIERLMMADKEGAKSVFIWDRLSDPDCLPCPRILPIKFQEDYTYRDGRRIKVRSVDYKFLSYDEAIEKLRSGEWENNMDRIYDGQEV